MVRAAPIDPPEVSARLWDGMGGRLGFDVGTNCGQSLRLMESRFKVVIGFEPCADSFEAARQAFPHIEVLDVAVSDHDGELLLAMIEGEQADTGQLVSPGTHGMEWDPGDWDAPGIRPVRVSARTLDTLALTFGEPDGVKIDTEGHELRVLRGAPKLRRALRTRWLIEFHNSGLYRSCKDLLEADGYEVETVRHPHYPPASDMYFNHGWIRAWPRQWA